MSNISRRDFLKTAGVMTLAVAAAGVLAGCDNKPAEPENPVVKPNQGLTETTEIGKFSFSVQDAKLVEDLKLVDGKSDVDYTNSKRVVALLLAVKNNGEEAASFSADNLKFYVNGTAKNIDSAVAFNEDKAKFYFGADAKPEKMQTLNKITVNADKAKADLYYVTINVADLKDGDGKFKDITSVQVRYQDANKAQVVNYDLGALTPTTAKWPL